jgi:ATP-binding cassette subfamily B (MDR/TAP) protein 6
MDEQIPCPPPPPIVVNDEFIWSTPVVYGPTLLLAITLFIGIPRYIYVTTHYHLHSESLLYQLSSFSKVIIYLCTLVTTSFVLDAVVIIARAIFADVWTSSELAFYIGISWLSWVISLAFLFHESQLFGKWYWTQYIFWEAAFLTETLVGWLWLNGVTRPKEGKLFKGRSRVKGK